MKNLRFNFCHPIKGSACLSMRSNLSTRCSTLLIDTRNSNQVVIPIDSCKEGLWSVVLNWEYEGASFSYHKDFEVKKKYLQPKA